MRAEFSLGLCPLQVFDEHMPGPNQLSKLREDVSVTAADLLAVPQVGAPAAGHRAALGFRVAPLPPSCCANPAAVPECAWAWSVVSRGQLLAGNQSFTCDLVQQMVPSQPSAPHVSNHQSRS